MEKHNQFRRSRFVTGLLIFFILSFPLFSNTITPASGERLISGQEIKFILDLPDSPRDVEVKTPDFPEGISFKGYRRSTNYDNGGTRIELRLQFDNSGTYTLNPLELTVKRKKTLISFDTVKISPNPKDLWPQFVITVTSPKTSSTRPVTAEGTPVIFKVYVKHALRITNFTHQLPENCILTQLEEKDWENTKKEYNENSSNLIEIGTWSWTPLKTGILQLPVFSCDAYNYSGYHQIIQSTPVFSEVRETAAVNGPNERIQDAQYSDAFYIEEKLSDSETADEKVQSENFEKLWKQINRRKTLIFVLLLVISLVSVLVALLFGLKRKWKLLVAALCAGILLLVPLSIMHSRTFMVFTGHFLFPIPEESAVSSVLLKPGEKVQVLSVVDDWYFVKTAAVSGWAHKGDFYGHE